MMGIFLFPFLDPAWKPSAPTTSTPENGANTSGKRRQFSVKSDAFRRIFHSSWEQRGKCGPHRLGTPSDRLHLTLHRPPHCSALLPWALAVPTQSPSGQKVVSLSCFYFYLQSSIFTYTTFTTDSSLLSPSAHFRSLHCVITTGHCHLSPYPQDTSQILCFRTDPDTYEALSKLLGERVNE